MDTQANNAATLGYDIPRARDSNAAGNYTNGDENIRYIIPVGTEQSRGLYSGCWLQPVGQRQDAVVYKMVDSRALEVYIGGHLPATDTVLPGVPKVVYVDL